MSYHPTQSDLFITAQAEKPLLNSQPDPTKDRNEPTISQGIQKKAMYSRFQIPPDLNICLLHQKATIFGFDEAGSNESCPCCHENVKTELSFSEATQRNIYKINEPVGFYYTFIKSMLVALLLVILLPGIYSIVWITQNCSFSIHSQNCDYVYGLAFPKLSVFYSPVFLLLNALNIIAIYIIVAFLFYWNVLIHEKISYSNIKAADQHSFISGFDSSYISEQDLRSQLQEYNIQQVIYTYKIKQIMKLLGKKYELQALKHKFYRDRKHEKATKTAEAIKEIDHQLIPLKNLFELGRTNEIRTDKIIIKFRSKEDKIKFQQEFKESICESMKLILCRRSKFVINNVNLYVQSLGDPREIIWQNLQIPSVNKYIYIIINNISMILILGLSFYLILQLTFNQQQYDAASEAMISLAFSVIVLVINKLLAFYIDFTTYLEGRDNVTGEIMSKIIKKIIVYFLNVTLIPFSLLIIESYRQSQQKIIQNILTLFLASNLFSSLASQFLQIPYFAKLYQRYRVKKQGKECLKTQIKANNLFEKNDFDLEDRYGLLCLRLTNCFFYAGIFPFGALITVIGLGLTYFTSKYVLRKHSSLPKISFRLGILITRIAATFPVIYSLGLVLNLYTYNENLPPGSLYSIILLSLSVPISLTFMMKGHEMASRFIKIQKIQESRINIISQVSYKDLNPCTFFFSQSQAELPSSDISTQLIANMMRFTAFRQALNVWRLNRREIASEIRQLQRERSALR